MRHACLLCCTLLLFSVVSQAATPPYDPWKVSFSSDAVPPVHTPLFDASLTFTANDSPQTAPPPRVAVEYSDAYRVRAKIHKYASIATLPLFATEVALGQSLYNGNGGDGKRGAHAAVGASIGVLFGVNTVTGAWNLWEARKDPNGRTLRWVHGLLMMAADAGFVATAALAPDDDFEEGEGGAGGGGSRSTHRTVALTSIGIATAGYLIMLFGR